MEIVRRNQSSFKRKRAGCKRRTSRCPLLGLINRARYENRPCRSIRAKNAAKRDQIPSLKSQRLPQEIHRNLILYLDDSIKILDQFPDESIDMIFADPPYNLSNGGFTVHAGKRVSVHKGNWDKSKGLKQDFEFHLKWIEACRRVLKPNGTIWISGTYHSIYACGFALQVAKYHILNDISWFKPNGSPNLSGRYFTASHETLIWARKEKDSKHIFNYKLMKEGDWPEDAF